MVTWRELKRNGYYISHDILFRDKQQQQVNTFSIGVGARAEQVEEKHDTLLALLKPLLCKLQRVTANIDATIFYDATNFTQFGTVDKMPAIDYKNNKLEQVYNYNNFTGYAWNIESEFTIREPLSLWEREQILFIIHQEFSKVMQDEEIQYMREQYGKYTTDNFRSFEWLNLFHKGNL